MSTEHLVVAATYNPTIVRVVGNTPDVAADASAKVHHALNLACCEWLFAAYKMHGDGSNAAADGAWKPTKARLTDEARWAARRKVDAEAALSEELLEQLATDARSLPKLVRADTLQAAGNIHVLTVSTDLHANDMAQLAINMHLIAALTDGDRWDLDQTHATASAIRLPGGITEYDDPALLHERCDTFIFSRPYCAPAAPVDELTVSRSEEPKLGISFLSFLAPRRSVSDLAAARGDQQERVELHFGVRPKDRSAAVKKLMKRVEAGEYKVSQIDGEGRTPLHWVVDWAADLDSRTHPTYLRNTILLLLEAGASPFICDGDGNSVFDLAHKAPTALSVLNEYAQNLDGVGRHARALQAIADESGTQRPHRRPLPPMTDVLFEVPAPRCSQAACSATQPHVIFVASGARLLMWDTRLVRAIPLADVYGVAESRRSLDTSMGSTLLGGVPELLSSDAADTVAHHSEGTSDEEDATAASRFTSTNRFIVVPYHEMTHGHRMRDVLLLTNGLLVGVDYTTADPVVSVQATTLTFDNFGGDGAGCCGIVHWLPEEAVADHSTRVTDLIADKKRGARAPHETGSPPRDEDKRTAGPSSEAAARASQSKSHFAAQLALFPYNVEDKGEIEDTAVSSPKTVSRTASTVQPTAAEDGAEDEVGGLTRREKLLGALCCFTGGRVIALHITAGQFSACHVSSPLAARVKALGGAIDQGIEWLAANELPEATRYAKQRALGGAFCAVRPSPSFATSVVGIASDAVLFACAEGSWLVYSIRDRTFTPFDNQRAVLVAKRRSSQVTGGTRTESNTPQQAGLLFDVLGATQRDEPLLEPLSAADIATSCCVLPDPKHPNTYVAVWAGKALYADAVAPAEGEFAPCGFASEPLLTVRDSERDSEAMTVAVSPTDPRGIYFCRRGELCRADVVTREVVSVCHFALTASEEAFRRKHGDVVMLMSGAQRIVFNADGTALMRHNQLSQTCVVYSTRALRDAVSKLTYSSVAPRRPLFCGHGIVRDKNALHAVPRERLCSFLNTFTSLSAGAQQRVDHCFYVMAALRGGGAGGRFTVSSYDGDGRMPLHILARSVAMNDLSEQQVGSDVRYLLVHGASLYDTTHRSVRAVDDLMESRSGQQVLARHVHRQLAAAADAAQRPAKAEALVVDNARRTALGRGGRQYFVRNHELHVRVPSNGAVFPVTPLRLGARDIGFTVVPPLVPWSPLRAAPPQPEAAPRFVDVLPEAVDVVALHDGSVLVAVFDDANPSHAPRTAKTQPIRGVAPDAYVANLEPALVFTPLAVEPAVLERCSQELSTLDASEMATSISFDVSDEMRMAGRVNVGYMHRAVTTTQLNLSVNESGPATPKSPGGSRQASPRFEMAGTPPATPKTPAPHASARFAASTDAETTGIATTQLWCQMAHVHDIVSAVGNLETAADELLMPLAGMLAASTGGWTHTHTLRCNATIESLAAFTDPATGRVASTAYWSRNGSGHLTVAANELGAVVESRTDDMHMYSATWRDVLLPRGICARYDEHAVCRPFVFGHTDTKVSFNVALGGPTLIVGSVDFLRMQKPATVHTQSVTRSTRMRVASFVDPVMYPNSEMVPCMWVPRVGQRPCLVALREGHLLLVDPLAQRRVDAIAPLRVSAIEQRHLVDQDDLRVSDDVALVGGANTLTCSADGTCFVRQSNVHPTCVTYDGLQELLGTTMGPLADPPDDLHVVYTPQELEDDPSLTDSIEVAYWRPPRTALLKGSLSSLAFFFAPKDEQLRHLGGILNAIGCGRANPNQKDADGRTPFHIVASVIAHMTDDEVHEWATRLVRAGCSPHLTNDQARSAFELSERLRVALQTVAMRGGTATGATTPAAKSASSAQSPALAELLNPVGRSQQDGTSSIASVGDVAHVASIAGVAAVAWSEATRPVCYTAMADGSVRLHRLNAGVPSVEVCPPSTVRARAAVAGVLGFLVTAVRDEGALNALQRRGNEAPEGARKVAALTYDLALAPCDMLLFSTGAAFAVRSPESDQVVEVLTRDDDVREDFDGGASQSTERTAPADSAVPVGFRWFVNTPCDFVVGHAPSMLPNQRAAGVNIQWHETVHTTPHAAVATIFYASRDGQLEVRRLFTPPGISTVFARHWGGMIQRSSPSQTIDVPCLNAADCDLPAAPAPDAYGITLMPTVGMLVTCGRYSPHVLLFDPTTLAPMQRWNLDKLAPPMAHAAYAQQTRCGIPLPDDAESVMPPRELRNWRRARVVTWGFGTRVCLQATESGLAVHRFRAIIQTSASGAAIAQAANEARFELLPTLRCTLTESSAVPNADVAECLAAAEHPVVGRAYFHRHGRIFEYSHADGRLSAVGNVAATDVEVRALRGANGSRFTVGDQQLLFNRSGGYAARVNLHARAVTFYDSATFVRSARSVNVNILSAALSATSSNSGGGLGMTSTTHRARLLSVDDRSDTSSSIAPGLHVPSAVFPLQLTAPHGVGPTFDRTEYTWYVREQRTALIDAALLTLATEPDGDLATALRQRKQLRVEVQAFETTCLALLNSAVVKGRVPPNTADADGRTVLHYVAFALALRREVCTSSDGTGDAEAMLAMGFTAFAHLELLLACLHRALLVGASLYVTDLPQSGAAAMRPIDWLHPGGDAQPHSDRHVDDVLDRLRMHRASAHTTANTVLPRVVVKVCEVDAAPLPFAPAAAPFMADGSTCVVTEVPYGAEANSVTLRWRELEMPQSVPSVDAPVEIAVTAADDLYTVVGDGGTGGIGGLQWTPPGCDTSVLIASDGAAVDAGATDRTPLYRGMAARKLERSVTVHEAAAALEDFSTAACGFSNGMLTVAADVGTRLAVVTCAVPDGVAAGEVAAAIAAAVPSAATAELPWAQLTTDIFDAADTDDATALDVRVVGLAVVPGAIFVVTASPVEWQLHVIPCDVSSGVPVLREARVVHCVTHAALDPRTAAWHVRATTHSQRDVVVAVAGPDGTLLVACGAIPPAGDLATLVRVPMRGAPSALACVDDAIVCAAPVPADAVSDEGAWEACVVRLDVLTAMHVPLVGRCVAEDGDDVPLHGLRLLPVDVDGRPCFIVECRAAAAGQPTRWAYHCIAAERIAAAAAAPSATSRGRCTNNWAL